MRLTVLYEDEYLLCVIKPAGIPSEGDGMPRLIGEYLSEAGSGASPYVGVIHRLDRDVSGVMVFAKRSRRLFPFFENKTINKLTIPGMIKTVSSNVRPTNSRSISRDGDISSRVPASKRLIRRSNFPKVLPLPKIAGKMQKYRVWQNSHFSKKAVSI